MPFFLSTDRVYPVFTVFTPFLPVFLDFIGVYPSFCFFGTCGGKRGGVWLDLIDPPGVAVYFDHSRRYVVNYSIKYSLMHCCNVTEITLNPVKSRLFGHVYVVCNPF